MSSLHREVMLVLLGDITGGAVAEGGQLPTLTELAGQFGVSTGVIRECQRALAERGLVSVRHGRRAVVRPEQDWDVFDPDVLAALVSGDRAAHVLAEYLESRRLLEVEAAGLAAERATPEAIKALSDAFDGMRAAAERARGNPAAEPLYHQAATFGALARPQSRFERGLPEHGRILEAIEGGDAAGARLAMREHLLTVEGYLRERTAATTREGGAAVPG